MKRFSLLLAYALFCSSCSTYYLSKVDSTEIPKDENTGMFTFENDSVKIDYGFYGEEAPIYISIFNKTDEPLFVDWKRSALIVGDQATSYMGDKMQLDADLNSTTWNYGHRRGWDFSSTHGSLNGSISVPQDGSFIPPHAKIDATKLTLSPGFYPQIPDSAYAPLEVGLLDGSVRKLKISRFSENNTPLSFRSYLTLYSLKGKEQHEVRTYQQQFYIKEVSKLHAKPDNLINFRDRKEDVFYGKQVKGRGVAAAGILVGGAVALGALDAAVDNQ